MKRIKIHTSFCEQRELIDSGENQLLNKGRTVRFFDSNQKIEIVNDIQEASKINFGRFFFGNFLIRIIELQIERNITIGA